MFEKFITDFEADFYNIVDSNIQEYKNMGFKFDSYDEWVTKQPQGRETTREAFLHSQAYKYVQLNLRLIPKMPRAVKLANDFVVPKGYEDGFRMFCTECEQGEDLVPRMSRQIWDTNKNDTMLFDLNIQHFHLGTVPDEHNPNIIKGREKILYAIIFEDVVFALRIDRHGRWSDASLLELAYDSFPEMKEYFDGFKMNINSCNDNFLDGETRQKLLSKGVNALVKIHDDYLCSPGGGVSGCGTSMRATIITHIDFHRVRQFEKLIDEYVSTSKAFLQKYFYENEKIELSYFDDSIAIFYFLNHPYELILVYQENSTDVEWLFLSSKLSIENSIDSLDDLMISSNQIS